MIDAVRALLIVAHLCLLRFVDNIASSLVDH